jgi:tetratricopeptide (TPR) repeat protein
MEFGNKVSACPVGGPAQLWVWRVAVLATALASISIRAQQPKRPTNSTTKDSAQSELTGRLLNARAARDSGSASAVIEANELVIASAARELADLRTAEGAYAQAADLYKTSQALEPRPATLLALATVDARAGNFSEAIQISNQIHGSDPQNLQAARILSSSLIQKGDFVAALEPLERVAATDHSVDTQYALANSLLQTKRPTDNTHAEQIFQRIAAEHGDSGSLHVLIGRAYRDADDLPSAIAQFQKALAIDPRTPHANYFLGLARLSQNEWRPTPEAEESIRKEAQLYPHDYLANFMSGFLLSEERRYADAEPFLKTAAALDPTVPDPWLYLGLNAYANANMAAAEADLRQAVKLTGTDEARSNYQIRRAYVDLGRILESSGRKDEGEVFLRKARDLQNETMKLSQQTIASMAGEANAAAVVSLPSATNDTASSASETSPLDSALLSRNTHLTDEQRAAFKQLGTQLRDVLALAYNDLGTAEATQGHYSAATSLYRKAEDWDSALPGLQKNLGQSEFRSGDFEGATSPLMEALLQEPTSRGLRAMLGISYYSLNRFSEAVRTFEPLGRAGMQDSEVGYAWAASLTHLDDNLRAAEVLTAFTVGQQRPPEVLLLVGQLWTAIGDYSRAIQTLQQALATDPSLSKTHFYEGLAYIYWEHWPEAAKEFQTELAIHPDDPDAEYHLGYVYMQQANTDAALRLFQQVAAAHPNYANAQYQLGKIELDRGDTQAAIEHLEAAERSSPQTAYIHYQLQAAYRKARRSDDAERELALYKQLKADARAQAAERAVVH